MYSLGCPWSLFFIVAIKIARATFVYDYVTLNGISKRNTATHVVSHTGNVAAKDFSAAPVERH